MTNPNDLEPGTQSGTAMATALGLMAVLIEELVRANAVDAGRLEARLDEFAHSASAVPGATPGEAQYVERLVKLVKGGLPAAHKGGGDE